MPARSSTGSVGCSRRWGTWPQQGEQWVQLDWAGPQRVNASDMYFFDDGGGVRVPASWKIQYWDGDDDCEEGKQSRLIIQNASYNLTV